MLLHWSKPFLLVIHVRYFAFWGVMRPNYLLQDISSYNLYHLGSSKDIWPVATLEIPRKNFDLDWLEAALPQEACLKLAGRLHTIGFWGEGEEPKNIAEDRTLSLVNWWTRDNRSNGHTEAARSLCLSIDSKVWTLRWWFDRVWSVQKLIEDTWFVVFAACPNWELCDSPKNPPWTVTVVCCAW